MEYDLKSKGYRLYSLSRNTIIISRDVLFDEEARWNWDEGKVQKQVVVFEEEVENEDNNAKESPPSSPRTNLSSS